MVELNRILPGTNRHRRHEYRRRDRRRRVRVLLAVGVAVGVVGAVGLAVELGGAPDAARAPASRAGRARVPVVSSTTAANPEVAAWFTPVRGEPVGLAVDDTDVAVAAYRQVQLLDAATGRARWSADLTEPTDYRPALAGDRVAVTGQTELVVLDRASGGRIGTAPFRGPGPVGFARGSDGRVVAVAGSDDAGVVLAVDTATGAARWSVEGPGDVWVAPQGVGDLVVVSWELDRGGTVIRALDAATGALRWEARTGAVASAPVVTAGLVVFADGATPRDARIRALDIRTGNERWAVGAPGDYDPALQPGSDGTTLYVVDTDGAVGAFDAGTGAARWRFGGHRPVVEGRLVLVDGIAAFPTIANEIVLVDAATGKGRALARPDGVPIDFVGSGKQVLIAIRLGNPSGVEADVLAERLP